MAIYVLDTNIISLIIRRNLLVQQRFNDMLSPDNHIVICPVVWYEVKRGLISKDAKQQIHYLETLIAEFEWQDYTPADWKLATELWAQRRAQGKPIADADLLIAVFARNRQATLITNNTKDFVDLGVTIENWLT